MSLSAVPLRFAAAACLALAALAPAAAHARESGARDAGLGEVTQTLSDPRSQAAVAAALAAMSNAMLDIKVEPMVRAMENAGKAMGEDVAPRDLPRGATVRDLAGRDADRLPGELTRRVPQAMGAMAGMAGALEAMLPQLEAMARRMKDALPQS